MSERTTAFVLALLCFALGAWSLWLSATHLDTGGGAGFGLMALAFFCAAVAFGGVAIKQG